MLASSTEQAHFAASSVFSLCYAAMTRIENPRVGGSIPPRRHLNQTKTVICQASASQRNSRARPKTASTVLAQPNFLAASTKRYKHNAVHRAQSKA